MTTLSKQIFIQNNMDWKDKLYEQNFKQTGYFKLLENMEKLVIVTEGKYSDEEVYAFIDNYEHSVVMITKSFDELFNEAGQEDIVINTFLDGISVYKKKGYRIVYDKITTHNFDRFNPLDWINKY